MVELELPLQEKDVRNLTVGDRVFLSGVIVTGRDRAHRWMMDNFIRSPCDPSEDDLLVYRDLKPLLDGGALYHCGPIVEGVDTGDYRITAAGPTTSIREEPYQSEVMEHFNIRAVLGKGGMGAETLAACRDIPAVYLHMVGGAAALIANSIRSVLGVYKLEFGVPEAMWVLDVEEFPAVVTMDANASSLHDEVRGVSRAELDSLLYAE